MKSIADHLAAMGVPEHELAERRAYEESLQAWQREEAIAAEVKRRGYVGPPRNRAERRAQRGR
jgi:hypothetical protein